VGRLAHQKGFDLLIEAFAKLGDDTLELVTGYGRMQGLVYREADARFKSGPINDAVSRALREGNVRMVNRNRGSGTRALIDSLLSGAKPPGYTIEANSHQAVATAIAQGRADFSVAIEVVARERQLGFRPLTEERFDFVLPRGRRAKPAVAAFCALLAEDAIKCALRERGFTT
jgi:putative molybdopterin biosynthesis protein